MANPIHKRDVEVGALYRAKVSTKIVTIRIIREHPRSGGWIAVNTETDRTIRIKSAAKLRSRV